MPISARKPRSIPAVTESLAAVISATLRLVKLKPGDIAVVLTDDTTSRSLNRRWRRIDRATDVLSFDYGTREGRVSGDLVISLDRLRAQARRFRVTPGEELARLVIHGALHLAGHDHHAAGPRRVMRALERRALAASRARVTALSRTLGR